MSQVGLVVTTVAAVGAAIAAILAHYFTNRNNALEHSQNGNPSGQTCCACYENVSNSSVTSTLCGHIFHKNCLGNYLKRSNSCPKCGRKIK